MSFDFFVEIGQKRLRQEKALRDAGLSLSVRKSIYHGGSRFNISIRNLSKEEVLVEKVGLIIRIPRCRGKRQWRVFLDKGGCEWCGVKPLDALDYDPHTQTVHEQQIGEVDVVERTFHRSDLQTVIWDTGSREAILIGFLRQQYGPNKIDIIPNRRGTDIDRIEAWQELGFELSPGSAQPLDVLVIAEGQDPYLMLEQFGQAVNKHIGRSFDGPPCVGMMTWYGYRTAIDEQAVLDNAKIIGELFDGYPQKMQNIMLLDHGWQEDANWGYWHADRKRFPHGMQWLAKKLVKYGLELGLWFTPFCATENAPNYKDLSPLLVLGKDGNPVVLKCNVWGQLPGHPRSRDSVFFDGDKKPVQDKWKNELERMKKWGVTYWKLDFFVLTTSYMNMPKIGTGKLYAKTWRNFRKAVGKKGHLAPCSCPTNLQLGYNNSMRIGTDIGNAGTWPGTMDKYRYGLSTIAALWYKHRNLWVNDADSIQIAKGCSLAEARVRATTVALSGGHLMLSEDLRGVANERLDIIRRLIPPYPKAARPLDLFENPFPQGYPSLWSLSLHTGFGPITVLAVFNLTQKTRTFTIEPDMLGIKPGKEFLALEWWQYRWLGRFRGNFKIDVPPGDVAVIHAQPRRSVPWLMSVSHHITGGYIIEDVSFDRKTGQLTGKLLTKPGLPVVLFGQVPKGWQLGRSNFHSTANSFRGWQSEIITTSKRTRFTISFEKK